MLAACVEGGGVGLAGEGAAGGEVEAERGDSVVRGEGVRRAASQTGAASAAVLM